MNSFKYLKTYFKGLQTAHKLLEGFCHGDNSKLRADVLSKQKSPLMWMETPFIGINKTQSAVFAEKKGAICIIAPLDEKNKTEDQQDDLLDLLEGIALDVVSKLLKDGREDLHKIDVSECDLDPIDPLLVDNWVGWRFEYTITNVVDICYNPENWN